MRSKLDPGFFHSLISDDKNLLVFPNSTEAEMAMVRAMKHGFGIEDSVAQRNEYIATALNALRNAKLPRDAAEIATLIESTQELIKSIHSEYTPGYLRGAFSIYAGDVKGKGNEWIRVVEILPAAETLFLQYLKLENKEAKAFIDSFLKLMKEHYENSETIAIQHFWSGKDKQTISDLGLSEDAASVLESTFPELFQYLYKNDYIVKKDNNIFKN